jgi:hypothetical protein
METFLEDSNETTITAIKLSNSILNEENTAAYLHQIALLSKGRWQALVELNLFSPKLTPATALGPKGCKVLSRTALPLIAWLNLSIEVVIKDCHAITAVGAAHLAKATWSTLRDVDLGMEAMTQYGTDSVLEAAMPSRRPIGKAFLASISVRYTPCRI